MLKRSPRPLPDVLEPGDVCEFKPVEARLGGWRKGRVVRLERDGIGSVQSITVKPDRGGAVVLSPGRVRVVRDDTEQTEQAIKLVQRARQLRKNKRYLKFVAQRPCVNCTAMPPSDPHHFGPRGMAQKTDDYRTTPLCRTCHDYWHQHGRLPGCESRMESELVLYRAQVDCLVAWLRTREDAS